MFSDRLVVLHNIYRWIKEAFKISESGEGGAWGCIVLYFLIFITISVVYTSIKAPTRYRPISTNRQGTEMLYFCNKCNNNVGGYILRETEYGGNGGPFTTETIVLDCGHFQGLYE